MAGEYTAAVPLVTVAACSIGRECVTYQEGRGVEGAVAEDRNNEKVRVVDRRWFTAEGDLKDPAPPKAAAPTAPPAPMPPPEPHSPTPEAPQERASAGDVAGLPSKVGFLDLVDFLAQQAVALLSGQVPGRGRDPETARFFIDLLAVVQEKTAGRLSPEETRYLDDVLFQLRSLFLAATR
jgi:hypothetical protein